MEILLAIDGRQVPFRSTGAFLLKYRAQFGKDPIKEVFRLAPLMGKYEELKNADDPAVAAEIFESLDLTLFYNFAWVFAKAADDSIPPPMEWFDSFSEFPILDIMEPLFEMLTRSLAVLKKK